MARDLFGRKEILLAGGSMNDDVFFSSTDPKSILKINTNSEIDFLNSIEEYLKTNFDIFNILTKNFKGTTRVPLLNNKKLLFKDLNLSLKNIEISVSFDICLEKHYNICFDIYSKNDVYTDVYIYMLIPKIIKDNTNSTHPYDSEIECARKEVFEILYKKDPTFLYYISAFTEMDVAEFF